MPSRMLPRAVALLVATAVAVPVAATTTTTTAAAASVTTPVPAVPRGGATPAPPRAVPAYVTPDQVQARTRAGAGPVDVAFAVRRPGGSKPLWGDWSGDGVETLAFFRGGAWTFSRSNVGGDRTGEGASTSTVRLGRRGDRPVAGDWDGDGRTDIGVKRGSRWLLARDLDLDRRTSTARVWRRFDFGGARSLPVAGNWDGRGPDGVGAFDRGVFQVTNELRSRPRTSRVRLAAGGNYSYRAGDVPVAGVWSGRRESVGVVRGSRWYLRSRLFSSRLSAGVIPRPARSVPAPWTTATGLRGEVCPTISADYRPTPGEVVAPTALASRSFGQVTQASGPAVRQALVRAERYALGTAYTTGPGRQANRVYADLRGGHARVEYAIRFPAMTALTVGIATATGAHDAAATGRSRAEAVGYVDFLVRSLACQHASVSPGGWGREGQSDHWSSMIGLAAWLNWDDLSVAAQTYVTSMVADEAAFQTELPMVYWRDRSGAVRPGPLGSGNTEAEETSWSVPLLELAVRMAPGAPRASEFRRLAVQRAAMAYSTKADLTGDAVVNGVRLDRRLDGYNALDDGLVINHGIVHPDYMGNVQHLWWGADLTRLAGVPLPEAYLHNGSLVYSALSTRNFVAGERSVSSTSERPRRYLSPGGTIYPQATADRSDIYFPDGTDWGLDRRAPFLSIDAHALTYGLAGPEAWSPSQALAVHTRGQLALGERSGADDGRTYDVREDRAVLQDRYVGREEYAGQQVATAWLALVVGELDDPGLDRSRYARPGDNPETEEPEPPAVPGP